MIRNNNIAFIMAQRGYVSKGFEDAGYSVFTPYKGKKTIARLTREICFRIPFLPKTIWYCKDILHLQFDYFIIRDPLITAHYLRWLRNKFPSAQFNFTYANMVGKAQHLKPNQIPSGIRIWTYDSYDSEKYKINLYRHHLFFESYLKPLKKPKYDIFFVGRDKGRGEWIINLEKELNKLGVTTKFIITKNRRFSKNKKFYKTPISYEEVINYLVESRSVLNVVMENQRGITLRDLEATFLGIKLITTNKGIYETEFYIPNNVLVLEDNNIAAVKQFLELPMVPVSGSLKKEHCVANWVNEIIR